MDIPSYQIKASDVIAVREKVKKRVHIQEALNLAARTGLPNWVSMDTDKLEGVFKNMPNRLELSSDIDEQLIIELYSR